MLYSEFLERVINEGIEAAKADYTEEKDKMRLEGSIAGFEACRGKSQLMLLDLWKQATNNISDAESEDEHHRRRCYQLEIEWVCNVVSALRVNEGKRPLLSWLPTVNGTLKAAKIIGAY